MLRFSLVIPAEAGIQHVSLGPPLSEHSATLWIPAFAGMTVAQKRNIKTRVACFCVWIGNYGLRRCYSTTSARADTLMTSASFTNTRARVGRMPWRFASRM